MSDTITLPDRAFILGEKKNIGVKNIKAENGASLASTTGSVIVYDSAGSSTLTTQSMTLSYNSTNTRAKALYFLTTGSTMNITAAGTYRAVYLLTFADGTVKQFEQVVTVKAKPF